MPVTIEKKLQTKANKDIAELEKLDNSIIELKLALESNEQFQQFMKFQDQFNKKSTELFGKLEKQMIENGIEKISGDWGYLTIVNRVDYRVEDEDLVPDEYKETKVVVDLSKVKEDIKLTGELPDGILKKETQHLRKGVKTLKALSA